MRVVEYGTEHPDILMLLHGGGLSWWNYQACAELLSNRFHVILPILDGHAGSDAPFTSIEDCAAEVIHYIDTVCGGHVLLIGGLSLGGQVLVEILSQRSTVCDYAIIESALTQPMKLTAALIQPAFHMCFPLIQKRWFARLQFAALHMKSDLFEQYYQDTRQISVSDMTVFLTANANYHIKSTLTSCHARVWVLAGSKEQPIMKRSAARTAQHLPASELHILKGFRHGDLSINHPHQYVDMLLQLIGQSAHP